MRSSVSEPVDWVNARDLGRAAMPWMFPKFWKMYSCFAQSCGLSLPKAGWPTHWNGSTLLPGLISVVDPGKPLEQLWGESAPGQNTIYKFRNSDYASPDFDAGNGKVKYGQLSPEQVL